MACNFLLLSSEKTEVVVLGPKHLKDTLTNDTATLVGITRAFGTTVRNLGVIFDEDLSFNSHIKLIIRAAFIHLWNISKIRTINHLRMQILCLKVGLGAAQALSYAVIGLNCRDFSHVH